MTLLELFQLLKKHLRFVLTVPVVCALVVGVFSLVLMHDEYTATSSMYVLVQQADSNSSSSLYSDLTASQMLSDDVSKLLKSDRIVNQVGSEVGVDQLKGYRVNVTSETTSRVITLSVTGPDAQKSADIVNQMVSDVSDVAHDVMGIQSVNPIDQAVAPSEPSGPKRLLYVLVAFIGGLFVAIAIVVISDTLNTKIRGKEDLEATIGVPVIGRIPVMKGGR